MNNIVSRHKPILRFMLHVVVVHVNDYAIFVPIRIKYYHHRTLNSTVNSVRMNSVLSSKGEHVTHIFVCAAICANEEDDWIWNELFKRTNVPKSHYIQVLFSP